MTIDEVIKDILEHSGVLYSEDQIKDALRNMAKKITADLPHDLIVLQVMMGGGMTACELVKYLPPTIHMGYIHASRCDMGGASGQIKMIASPHISLEGKTVLLVDDIIDGGLTLAALVKKVQELGAAAVYTAVLINKARIREPGGLQNADYYALDRGNKSIYGFGLDYKNKRYLRNLPAIYAVDTGYKPRFDEITTEPTSAITYHPKLMAKL